MANKTYKTQVISLMRGMYSEHRWRRCNKCGHRLHLQAIIARYDHEKTELRRYSCTNNNCAITSLEIMCMVRPILYNICEN